LALPVVLFFYYDDYYYYYCLTGALILSLSAA
jgi:hypothetical protein